MNSEEEQIHLRPTTFNIISKAVIFILVCLPLFFINIRTDIDWGDDNAQYLAQAKNIVHGIPQSKTGYVFNSDCAVLGPPAYPVGFPLLLSPVYAFAGNNMLAFSYTMTFFLLLFSAFAFLYFTKHHKYITSIILLMIIIYNPWTLSFKSEIMSEIPFAAALLIIYLLSMSLKGIKKILIVGLLSGFLISVRTIGLVVPVAIFIYACIEKFSHRKKIKTQNWNIWESFIVAIVSVLFYYGLNNLIFVIPADPSKSYASIFFSHDIFSTISNNLSHYIYLFQLFFEPQNDKLLFLTLATKAIVFTLVLLGYIYKMIKNVGLSEIIILVYLLVLLVYPYTDSGYRFLFPLLPFFMHYLVEGFKRIDFGISMRKSNWAIFFGVLILIQYGMGIKGTLSNNNYVQEGPCTEEASSMFRYVMTGLPKDAVFAFNKPRACAFFAERNCMVLDNNLENYSFQKTDSLVKSGNIRYFILYNLKPGESPNPYYGELSNKVIEKYLTETSDSTRIVWDNSRYSIVERCYATNANGE